MIIRATLIPSGQIDLIDVYEHDLVKVSAQNKPQFYDGAQFNAGQIQTLQRGKPVDFEGNLDNFVQLEK